MLGIEERRNGHKEGALLASPMEAPLWAFKSLQGLYLAFDAAERELVKSLGVPICIPNCGKCCQLTSGMAWNAEAYYIASYLSGNLPLMAQVLPRCEGWLEEKDPEVATYGLNGSLTEEQKKQLEHEVDILAKARPCPFLSGDKRCLIHAVRPLACRVYGVTHVPAPLCPRPLSRMESADERAHIGHSTPLGLHLKQFVDEAYRNAEACGWGMMGFLPATLASILRPRKVSEIRDKVARARLVQCSRDWAITFQDQLNTIWEQGVAH